MLKGFLTLLVCQLLGELLVVVGQIPVPGPVMGAVLLLTGLVLLKRTPADLRLVSEGLLSHLAFLFVPAGVGLMVHLEMISQYWLGIMLALFISTLLTLVGTALVFKLLLGRKRRKGQL